MNNLNSNALKVGLILYDSRSGSTFLSSLLDRYSGILVLPETSLLYNILLDGNQVYDSIEKIDALLHRLYEEKQFEELSMDRSVLRQAILSGGELKIEVFYSILCVYFGMDRLDDHVVVMKIPRAHERLEHFNRFLPDFRVVHLIRDGRAVFYSKMKSRSLTKRVFEKNLIVAALGWRSKIRSSTSYGDEIITVRYEDILADEESNVQKILDFLHISEKGRVISNDASNYLRKIGKEQQKFHRNIGKKPKELNPNRYLEELSSAQISLYECIAGDILRKHGYTAHRNEMSLYERFIGPFFLLGFYCLQFVGSRSMIVMHSVFEGTFKEKVRNKLIDLGLLKIKVST
ncbi:MAG: hypothetical protein GC178_09890 [Flavobacteriales bacterium]|nr:hypothetical protein [Flavobacteriales bacterium]